MYAFSILQLKKWIMRDLDTIIIPAVIKLERNSQVTQLVNSPVTLPAMLETLVQSLGQEDLLKKG